VKPYFERDGITLFHGDCREILPGLGKVDLLLTDPPYGIGEARNDKASRSCLAQSRDYGKEDWDDFPPDAETIEAIRSVARWQIIFGGNYFQLPPATCWLVWDKQNGSNDFADCELAWTNLPKAVRRIVHQWHGMIRKGHEQRFHRTQKPLAVMEWCINQLPQSAETILDPFAGSSTTLLAAWRLGRKAIGIELSENFCEISANRLNREMDQGRLFKPESVTFTQPSLLE